MNLFALNVRERSWAFPKKNIIVPRVYSTCLKGLETGFCCNFVQLHLHLLPVVCFIKFFGDLGLKTPRLLQKGSLIIDAVIQLINRSYYMQTNG